MDKSTFKCPRCGRLYDRKDGIKLSIVFDEKEEYNPVPSGTKVTSYYKMVYFCKSCEKQLKINRALRYILVIAFPTILFPILTYFSKGDFVSGLQGGIICSIIVAVLLLPLIVIIYRKIKMKTINRKYIERAYEDNAIV